MELIFISFLAGVLTILAPCVLSLLPVIIGGSVGETSKLRPLIIVASLSLSVIVFTLLLKLTSLAFTIPAAFWKYFSGGLITLFALTMIFPALWEKIAFKLKLYKSEGLIEKSNQQEGWQSAALLGASLGPVFTTCSPTYSIIIATVLPANFAMGFIDLVFYALGMSLPLLAIGYGGRAVVQKLRFAANPYGWFKRGLGILLLITGILILSGLDKKFEAYLIEQGFTGLSQFEQTLLQ